MSNNYFSVLTVVLILSAPLTTHADSLRCGGDIISPGDTEQELLDVCGNPVSREGGDWLYEIEGSIPRVVTMGNGVVMFIRDLDESDAGFGTHPLGDRP
jgi:hypothetical protein